MNKDIRWLIVRRRACVSLARAWIAGGLSLGCAARLRGMILEGLSALRQLPLP